MDMVKVKEFCRAEWLPKSYDDTDLCWLFDISLVEARRIIKMINAGAEFSTVMHHDLQEYTSDLISISRVPTDGSQVSKGAHWLVVAGGWGFDPRYSKYRYVDPEDPESRFTLRGALRVHFERYGAPENNPRLQAGLLAPTAPRLLEGPSS